MIADGSVACGQSDRIRILFLESTIFAEVIFEVLEGADARQVESNFFGREPVRSDALEAFLRVFDSQLAVSFKQVNFGIQSLLANLAEQLRGQRRSDDASADDVYAMVYFYHHHSNQASLIFRYNLHQ